MKSKPTSWNQAQGLAGETLAKKFLETQGFIIVAERYRNRFGEVDLIAQKGEILLFVEVKSRCGPHFGDPLEAITPQKIRHLLKAAGGFLLEFPEYQQNCYWELAAIAVRNYESEDGIELVRILP